MFSNIPSTFRARAGAAVARAAKEIGAPCRIVVPSTTPAAKLANIARYCETVVQCEPTPAARAAAGRADTQLRS